MILAHTSTTWPLLQNGQLSEAETTRAAGSSSKTPHWADYGDVVLGIYEHRIVNVYDVTCWRHTADGKVNFDGAPSALWSRLINTPNPGKLWASRDGAINPVTRHHFPSGAVFVIVTDPIFRDPS